jgi:hypothetical protein
MQLDNLFKSSTSKCHVLSPSGWDHPCRGVLSTGQPSKERITCVPKVKPCGKVEQQSVVTRDAKSVNHLGKTEACGHFGVKPWVRVGRLSHIVVNPLLQSFHCLKRDNKHRKISVNQDISPDLPHLSEPDKTHKLKLFFKPQACTKK